MQVSLNSELERFVEELMATGKFGNASEVVSRALELLQEHEREIDDIRTKIDAGLEDVKAGRVFSPEEAKALLSRRRENWARTAR